MSVEQLTAAEYYDNHATTYETDLEACAWTGRTMLQNFLALDADREVSSVLDLGAGVGYSFEAVAERYQLDRVVAVDGSGEMLAQYRERFAGRFPFETVQADMVDYVQPKVEAEDERFDLALAIATLNFLDEADVNKVAAGVSQRLKTSGSWIFTYDPVIEFSEEQVGTETPATQDEPAVFRLHLEAMTTILEDNGLRAIRHRLNVARLGARFVGGFVEARLRS